MSGCQLWLHVDAPQCTADANCVALLGEGADCGPDGVCRASSQLGKNMDELSALESRWSCARSPAEPSPLDTNPSRSVRVRMDVVDANSLGVPPGLIGAVCFEDDADCTRPSSEKIAPGGDGFLQLEVPYASRGYIRLEAPGYVPVLAYDARPYTERTNTHGPLMFTHDELATLAADGGGAGSLASRGLAWVDMRDCNDTAGDGVRLELAGGRPAVYFAGAEPAPNLTQTVISNQLSAGREPRAVGVFTDLDPGPTMLRVVLPESGEVVSRASVAVRAGHITYVRLRAGY